MTLSPAFRPAAPARAAPAPNLQPHRPGLRRMPTLSLPLGKRFIGSLSLGVFVWKMSCEDYSIEG